MLPALSYTAAPKTGTHAIPTDDLILYALILYEKLFPFVPHTRNVAHSVSTDDLLLPHIVEIMLQSPSLLVHCQKAHNTHLHNLAIGPDQTYGLPLHFSAPTSKGLP